MAGGLRRLTLCSWRHGSIASAKPEWANQDASAAEEQGSSMSSTRVEQLAKEERALASTDHLSDEA